MIRGHPSPFGFDLVGSAFGTVALDRIVDGSACRPGDALIGLPASGVHSNGLTLARRALLDQGRLALDATPDALGGGSVADALLEPTTIYVRAVLELLRSDIPVHGLSHITGGGVLNLLRIGTDIGYEVSSPLPAPPVFSLIAELGGVVPAEMWEVFNMGCGFCVNRARRSRGRGGEVAGGVASGGGASRTLDRAGWSTQPAAAGAERRLEWAAAVCRSSRTPLVPQNRGF